MDTKLPTASEIKAYLITQKSLKQLSEFSTLRLVVDFFKCEMITIQTILRME